MPGRNGEVGISKATRVRDCHWKVSRPGCKKNHSFVSPQSGEQREVFVRLSSYALGGGKQVNG